VGGLSRGDEAVTPEMEPLGVVALTAVRAVTSEARLLRELQPGAVAAGMRGVEESHALETRMPVEVIAPSAQQDVRALIEGLDAFQGAAAGRARPRSTISC
jgi:hypothetical protein